jgi:hypothetical protein
VHVDRVSVTACAANPSAADASAQIFGAFFNTGEATPHSHVNDVVARLTIGRASNSLDPADRLRVTGTVLQCRNDDCSDALELSTNDLGTALVGATTALSVRWMPGNHAFEFRKDTRPRAGGLPRLRRHAAWKPRKSCWVWSERRRMLAFAPSAGVDCRGVQ